MTKPFLNAIVTMAFGEPHLRLSDVTRPTMEAYAKRVGARFHILERRIYPEHVPAAFERLQIRDLVGTTYERVLYLDNDTIVRSDTPDLFRFIPMGSFGAMNCAHPRWRRTFTAAEVLEKHARTLGIQLPPHDGRYFNTGVFVCDASHRTLFADPPSFANCHWEQGYLNLMLFTQAIWIAELPHTFNHCLYMPASRLDSYIIHYQSAGEQMTPALARDLAMRDLTNWKELGY